MGPRAKRYDHDNLVAGCKPLLDELVTSGLLLDDDDARASVTYGQERGDHNATRIEIAEAA